MHDSRMIAEVVPPGTCAIENVSGSRIATPLAPPSPGSTPMITPRMIPANISATFFSDSAITKPCSSDWISSTSGDSEQVLQRPLGQRDLEPDFEDQEEHDAVADADRNGLPPRILAQPAHEERDEHGRRDVDPEPADQPDVQRRGNEHREYELELADFDERLVLLFRDRERGDQVHQRRGADDQPEVDRKVARLRAVVGPLRAEARAVVDDDRAEPEKQQRQRDFSALDPERRPPVRTLGHPPPLLDYFAIKPAPFIRATCRASSLATQSAYS